MKRLILSASLVIAVAAGAHSPPGELFFAAQFPDNLVPTMDGNLSDWDIVPLDPYTIRSDRLYSPVADIQPVGRGELDASDMVIRHLVGWNDNSNKIYVASEVFDNIHNTDREDAARFNHDDAWEIEVNPDHTPTEDHNPEGLATNFSYKWAVPPVEGQYQFYRPNAALSWLVDGSSWVDFGWGFTGDQFGESTYFYELAVTPIEVMPRSNDTTEDQAVVHDLEEEEIIHISMTVGDIDEATSGDFVLTSYQGFWTLTPESCCTATNDFVMAPVEPSIAALSETAVEEVTWGQIKAGF
jgi:hypothetical protein